MPPDTILNTPAGHSDICFIFKGGGGFDECISPQLKISVYLSTQKEKETIQAKPVAPSQHGSLSAQSTCDIISKSE